jgi:hypothetical protein
MSHLTRRLIVTCAALLAAALPIAADAGRQAERRPPPAREPQRQPTPPPERQAKPREPARQAGERARPAPKSQARVVVRGPVFVGGYFYDPLYGPYPWWPRTGYPHWYVPIYDQRADLRVKVTPKDSAVYVDGFYAGLVDEFDGVFQALPLPPGGHRVLLYRPGYRSERFRALGTAADLHPRAGAAAPRQLSSAGRALADGRYGAGHRLEPAAADRRADGGGAARRRGHRHRR